MPKDGDTASDDDAVADTVSRMTTSNDSHNSFVFVIFWNNDDVVSDDKERDRVIIFQTFKRMVQSLL